MAGDRWASLEFKHLQLASPPNYYEPNSTHDNPAWPEDKQCHGIRVQYPDHEVEEARIAELLGALPGTPRDPQERLEQWCEDMDAQQTADLQQRAAEEDETCSECARDLGEEGRGKSGGCRDRPAQGGAVGGESGEHLHGWEGGGSVARTSSIGI